MIDEPTELTATTIVTGAYDRRWLAERKQELIALGDADRDRLQEEWQSITREATRLGLQVGKYAAIASGAALAAASFSLVRPRRVAAASGVRKWPHLLLRGIRTLGPLMWTLSRRKR